MKNVMDRQLGAVNDVRRMLRGGMIIIGHRRKLP